MLKQDRKSFIPPRNNNDLTNTLEKLILGKKVSVFIDAANLYHSSSVARLRIDFIQVIRWFKAHCKLKNANFYTAYDIEDQKQMEFLADLEFNGYSMIKKPLKIFENSKKGNMDIEIAVDCLTQQNLYDIIILISGDGDFSYLMQTLEKLGKQTVVIGVGGFTSFELHQEVNEYFFFNRIRSVWQTPRVDGQETSAPIKNVLLPKSSDPLASLEKIRPSTPLDQKTRERKLVERSPKQITEKPKNERKIVTEKPKERIPKPNNFKAKPVRTPGNLSSPTIHL
jgi:uncharacterized LabA/DUF88 family protein